MTLISNRSLLFQSECVSGYYSAVCIPIPIGTRKQNPADEIKSPLSTPGAHFRIRPTKGVSDFSMSVTIRKQDPAEAPVHGPAK